MKRVMKRFFALLTVVLWSLGMTLSASASMTVLCVEKSGSRVIEYSVNAHCADAASIVSYGSADEISVHCNDCSDTSLTASVTSVSPRVINKLVVAQIASYVTAILDTVSNSSETNSEIALTPPLAASRSTHIGQRYTIVIQQ